MAGGFKFIRSTGNRDLDQELTHMIAANEALAAEITALKNTSASTPVQGPPGPPGLPGSSATSGLIYADFSVPGGNTVANTTAETAFASQTTLNGLLIPINTVFRVTAYGTHSRAAAAANLTLRAYLNSTKIWDSGVITLTGPFTNLGWGLMGVFQMTAAGSSGTIEAQADAYFDNQSIAGVTSLQNTAPISIDWTQAQLFKMTWQYSVADPANTTTLRALLVEQL